MKLEVIDCFHHVLQSFSPSVPSSHFRHYSSPRMKETNTNTNTVPVSNQSAAKTLSMGSNSTQTSRGHSIRRSRSFNLDDIGGSGRSNGEETRCHKIKKKMHLVICQNPFTNEHRGQHHSFLFSRYYFSEPVVYRIWPVFRNRPDQDTMRQTTLEGMTKRFDIPPALSMMKKKLQSEESFTGSQQPTYCPLKEAFASLVFIIAEFHKYGLHMREVLCHDNLDTIKSRVQIDMHSSFVWLFHQVFSKTPALMLHVMILLANFFIVSSHDIAMAEASPSIEKKQTQVDLWLAIVEEAAKMNEGVQDEVVLTRDIMQQFVSPVSVKIEPDDDYEQYRRTDIQYQMNLIREPNNTLLLCNYAQFLHIFSRDQDRYDRAEECFKKAIAVSPEDGETLHQYAKFLHVVRMDLSSAEEMFLQAMSMEPENPFYISTYTNFLWSTGDDEACFPGQNTNV